MNDAQLLELKDEAQRLLNLLNDPQPGLWVWNNFLNIRLNAVHELTGELLNG